MQVDPIKQYLNLDISSAAPLYTKKGDLTARTLKAASGPLADLKEIRHAEKQMKVLMMLERQLRGKAPILYTDPQMLKIQHKAQQLFERADAKMGTMDSGKKREEMNKLADAIEEHVLQHLHPQIQYFKAHSRVSEGEKIEGALKAEEEPKTERRKSLKTSGMQRSRSRLSLSSRAVSSKDLRNPRDIIPREEDLPGFSPASAAASVSNVLRPPKEKEKVGPDFLVQWFAGTKPTTFFIMKDGSVNKDSADKIPDRKDKEGQKEYAERANFTFGVLDTAIEYKKTGRLPSVSLFDRIGGQQKSLNEAAERFLRANPNATVKDLRKLALIYLDQNRAYLSEDNIKSTFNYEGMVSRVSVAIDPNLPHPSKAGTEVFRLVNAAIEVRDEVDTPVITPLLKRNHALFNAKADPAKPSFNPQALREAEARKNFTQLINLLGRQFGVSPEDISASIPLPTANAQEDANAIFDALNRNPKTKPIADALHTLSQAVFNAVATTISETMNSYHYQRKISEPMFSRNDHTNNREIIVKSTPRGLEVSITISINNLPSGAFDKSEEPTPEQVRQKIAAESEYQLDARITLLIGNDGTATEPRIELRDVFHKQKISHQREAYEKGLKQLTPPK